jgi:hypothetical protein
MNTDVVVRPIEAADFAAITALLAELGNPAITPQIVEDVRAVFLRHINAPDTISVV